jgi:hypothetical protein
MFFLIKKDIAVVLTKVMNNKNKSNKKSCAEQSDELCDSTSERLAHF